MPGNSFAGADFPIPAVTGSQPAVKLCGRLNSHIDRLLIWKQDFLRKKYSMMTWDAKLVL